MAFTYLTFIRPCIVIYFYSTTNQIHQCIKFIYFGMTLYMFRTVFASIISSSRLYMQQQAFVKQKLLPACYYADSSICIYSCCMYSLEVLMMGAKTVRNM